ncbi:MAG: glycosyltransferase [Actinomycetota bacterium]|nr:glycosyltransferase [Actinomycetota bacterium]
MTETVALAHDYLTQRGGAERVVLSMLAAFPAAPVHTSLYAPERTFPEFSTEDIRTLSLNRFPFLRHDHRRALPLLAPSFERLRIDADLVLCSSSGWAHGLQTDGVKVVYCYTPARWLYQSDHYLRTSSTLTRATLVTLAPWLKRWDRRAARSAQRYLTSSTAVRDRIAETYGIEATVVPPPQTIDVDGEQEPVEGVEPGFFLCVSRLLPYKHVEVVMSAVAASNGQRLIVVGSGPERPRLEALTAPGIRLLGSVAEAQLRWLYASCRGVVSAAYEDYGLTPLEAAAFGKPTAALRWGGFLDTLVEGDTGVFFDEPVVPRVARALEALDSHRWDASVLRAHAERFAEHHFVERLRSIVSEELARA